ncbi:interferon-induced very large GTPase 1-like [Astyanax mexicanus]|uniref:interferon-induced very large GTPase 1-like n=1 Tax=Astyanax mexicanus TaxID=7994 RepID=UPI0020CAC3B4|nr:interferon-induced very large GTPase 1-like [Astyanax mexicanus]
MADVHSRVRSSAGGGVGCTLRQSVEQYWRRCWLHPQAECGAALAAVLATLRQSVEQRWRWCWLHPQAECGAVLAAVLAAPSGRVWSSAGGGVSYPQAECGAALAVVLAAPSGRVWSSAGGGVGCTLRQSVEQRWRRWQRELRMVLLGKVGAGKSASGNTLLGTSYFSSILSARPVTQQCEAQSVNVGGRWLTVVDTPGLTAQIVTDTAKKKLLQCLQLSTPGPNVFLFVIRLDRFTQEEQGAVQRAVEVFGLRLYMFTIILFTLKDRLKNKPVEEYISTAGESLQQLLQKCGNRYHAFNNNNPCEDNQAEQLLVKVDRLVEANCGRWYTTKDCDLDPARLMQQNVYTHTEDSGSHSLGATAEDVVGKEEDLHVKIQDLVCKLNLHDFYPHELTTGRALNISRTSNHREDPLSEKDVVSVYLNKLFRLDYGARYVTFAKDCVTDEIEKNVDEDFNDFLYEDNKHNSCENNQIHPMDVQMAVFYCADSFLSQNMVKKLSSCQYALPLMVPNPTSADIELPLWTFQQIKKTWRSVDGCEMALPVCQLKTPMVFFCRLGSVAASKSQLLNSLINPKHDTFFHRDSPGSSKSRLLINGLVEIAWYCPAGNADDHFSECIAFCNLHGDAVEHRKQTDFLTEQSTVNIVLMQNMKLNDEAKELLQKLHSSSKPLICVVCDLQKGPLKIAKGYNVKLGLNGRNKAQLHKEMITAVEICLQKCNTFSLEKISEVAKCSGFRVNECNETLISKLNLSAFFPNKLTDNDVLSIKMASFQSEDPQTEKDLVSLYLSKLFTLDYRFRSITLIKLNTTIQECVTDESEDFFDFFSDFQCEEYEDTYIHPMDIQMAVFYCADRFLRQNMMTKLSFCQYALPILVPSPLYPDIEFSLWTFRQIKKTWKSVGDSSRSLPVCQVKAPMVFFCRLGSVSTSKSQLLNSLINQRHDTFFHRDSQGSSKSRIFMDGIVEIAWYCPAGNTDDHFRECTAFCNLHGDAVEHRKQTDFLTEQATVTIVLVQNMKLNDEAKEFLKKLYSDSSKHLICLINDLQKSPLTVSSGNNIKIGLKDRNQAELHKELIEAVRMCLQKCKSSPTFNLEKSSELAKHCGFRVDEDSEDCQEGKNAALKVMKLLKGEDISQIKAKFLPCHGKLWHEWSWKNKLLYQLYGEVEQIRIQIQLEMHSIRDQQRKQTLDLIKAVHVNVNSMSITEKAYFVKWLGVYLDDLFSDQLSEVTQQYYKQLSEVYLLKQKGKMTEEKQEQLERLSEKVDSLTLGLEHIVREMGQLYEAWSAKPEEMDADVSALPALAADLLISGNPLELMDGDAAHVPLTWIESVLDKVIERLGDQRVFVLSVLGLQSSGKSTLLNTMFGLQFAVSAGRCTRGAFMQLIRVKEDAKEELKIDYILVVDTEGLQSLQLVSKQSALAHDNELATFVTGLADLTLINIFGENPAEMQNIIQIVVQAFLRMKKVRLTPSCMFVHQNATDISAGEKNMEGRRRLQEKLDQMTCLAAAEEVVSAESFTDVIKFDIQTDVHYFSQLWEGNPPMAPPNPLYSENVQKLKQAILRSAAQKTFSLRISEFKVHIKDLWTAVLNEDFVFSFKNTLEISAYRKLEVMYGKWTWKLREKMLLIQNRLQNQIENGKLVPVDQKQIHEEMSDTFCSVKKEMETFFTEDRDAEILSQWKVRTGHKIADVHDSLCKATEVKMNELCELKKTCKMLDDRKRQYENEMFNMSKVLASRLKHKAADEQELRRDFDTMWEKWLSNLKKEVPPIKDVDIEQEVMNILSSFFERGAIYSSKQSGDYKKIYDKVTYSEYVTVKKKMIFLSHSLNSEDHDSIRELVQQTVRKAEEIIRNKPVAKTGYSDTYTQEILNCVMEKVKGFGSKKFRLRNEFSVDLSLYICDTAVKKFTELHRVFREANDPLIYLEMMKEDFFSVFKMQFQGASATTVSEEFLF